MNTPEEDFSDDLEDFSDYAYEEEYIPYHH